MHLIQHGVATWLLVSEPDPQKIWKGGLGDRLGWKCIVSLEYRCTSNYMEILTTQHWYSSRRWDLLHGERSRWSLAAALIGFRSKVSTK